MPNINGSSYKLQSQTSVAISHFKLACLLQKQQLQMEDFGTDVQLSLRLLLLSKIRLELMQSFQMLCYLLAA